MKVWKADLTSAWKARPIAHIGRILPLVRSSGEKGKQVPSLPKIPLLIIPTKYVTSTPYSLLLIDQINHELNHQFFFIGITLGYQ